MSSKKGKCAECGKERTLKRGLCPGHYQKWKIANKPGFAITLAKQREHSAAYRRAHRHADKAAIVADKTVPKDGVSIQSKSGNNLMMTWKLLDLQRMTKIPEHLIPEKLQNLVEDGQISSFDIDLTLLTATIVVPVGTELQLFCGLNQKPEEVDEQP